MAENQQLLIGVGVIVLLGGILYYSQLKQEDEDDVNEQYGGADKQSLSMYEEILQELMSLEAEYDFTIAIILKKPSEGKEEVYLYEDYFAKFRPAEHGILTEFRGKLIRLRAKVLQCKKQTDGTTMGDRTDWDSIENSINTMEHDVDNFFEELASNLMMREKDQQAPEIQVQNVFNRFEQYVHEQQRLREEFMQQQKAHFQSGHYRDPRLEAADRRDSFVQNSRNNILRFKNVPDIDIDMLEAGQEDEHMASLPDPDGSRKRKPKRKRSSGGFDQGASTKQRVNREGAKPPAPTDGEYGSLGLKPEQIPTRLKSPDKYVKMILVQYDQILKFCNNAPGAQRYVQKMVCQKYRRLMKYFFLLDLALTRNNVPVERIPGAVTARTKAARCATQIFDILGFNVKKGFSETTYAKDQQPAPASGSAPAPASASGPAPASESVPAPASASPPAPETRAVGPVTRVQTATTDTQLRGSPARKKQKPQFSQVPALQDVLKRQAQQQLALPAPGTPKKQPPKLKEELRTPKKDELP